MSASAEAIETTGRVINLTDHKKPKKQDFERSFVRIFYEVDMRCSHDGLAEIAKKGNQTQKGIDVAELKEGQFILFLNNALNRFKIFAANDVVAYKRVKSGKIDMTVIQDIPKAFQGHDVGYDKLVKRRLERYFEKKGIALEDMQQKAH